MIVWISLIGGIILGWLIEWLIDWVYWRRGIEAFYRTELELRRELEAAQDAARVAQEEAAGLRAQLIALGVSPQPAPDMTSEADLSADSDAPAEADARVTRAVDGE